MTFRKLLEFIKGMNEEELDRVVLIQIGDEVRTVSAIQIVAENDDESCVNDVVLS